MKRIDLGQTVTILANLGVIAGIVFLGLELRQNNELLTAQGRAVRFESRQGVFEEITNNPPLIQTITKAKNGRPLTEEEQFLLTYFQARVLTNWQYAFTEYQAGFISEEDMGIPGWRFWFHEEIPGMPDYWTRVGTPGRYRSDFIEFLNENVVNKP